MKERGPDITSINSGEVPPSFVQIQELELSEPTEIKDYGGVRASKRMLHTPESFEYVFLEDAKRLINSPGSVSNIPYTLANLSFILNSRLMKNSIHLVLFTDVLRELEKKYKV